MNSFVRSLTVTVFPILFGVLCCSICPGQDIGDRVCVTANFPTKIKEQKVGEVFEGSIHTVLATSGNKWCALEGVNGWLPLEYVMNLRDAEAYYSKRIDSNDEDFAAFAHRGMIHRENEELQKAFNDLNSSLRLNKENASTWSNRGVIYNSLGDREKAIKDLTYSLKLNKENPFAYYNLGNVHYGAGNYIEAIKNFDKAIELRPKEARFFIDRAIAKQDSGKLEEARKDYEKSIKINKRVPDSYIGMSNYFLASDNLEQALEYAEKAVDIQPKNAVSLNHRGWVLYKLGKIEDSMFDLNRAINYAPKLQLAFNNRAICNVALGNHEEAIKDYNRCIELSGRNVSPITYGNRAIAFEGMQEYGKALKDFETAIELGGEIPEVLNGLAWFLAVCPEDDYRDAKKAIEFANKAIETGDGEDDWNFIDTLAAAYAENGQFDKAIEKQTKAVELAPDDEKKAYEERLKLYKSEKPYRSDIGKGSSQSF